MSILKNEGYLEGKEYYLPERVFFHNLCGYCRCKTDDFLDEIYWVMGRDIEDHISDILLHLEAAEKNHNKSTKKTARFLPPSFKKFVDEEECKLKSSKKDSYYLLSRCYKNICAANDHILRANTNKTYNPSNLVEDRKTIERFQKISDGANPLSTRDFNRIQHATGVPLTRRTPEIRSYTENQDIVVRFAIEKIIPSMIIRQQRPMLSFLASRDWQDVVCKKNASNGISDCVIVVDSIDDKGFSKAMSTCFEELKTIANHPKDEQNDTQLGSVLIKMYNRIYAEHKNGIIWGIQSTNAHLSKTQKEGSLSLADDKKYEHDGLISTHILNWLDTHHFAHQDIPEFMESIGRVIDKIRPQILAEIGTTFSMEEFRTCGRVDESCNSLFAWASCECLLRLLLDTLRVEPIIFFKCHDNGRST